ncbi:MAG: hypothetical protein HKN26_00625 [Acidimicrobiales bacterium]|nr:hypothetical protein [Acidimicrobiales bacterium]
MLTTGFKTFFGYGVFLAVAAVLYGWSTGGGATGPLSLGYLGGVGDHVGYAILLFASAMMFGLGGLLVAYRDADPAAQANLLGISATPAAQRPTQPSFWPIVGAFGVGMAGIGLVVSPILFGVGCFVLGIVAIEWMMQAWADRATGDPVANRELRDRIMGPIEIPVLGLGIVAVVILAMSRILLAVSVWGAVAVAGVAAAVIFGTAVFLNFRPNLNRNVVTGLLLVGAVAVLAGGITAAAIGPRDFHHEEHSEAGVGEGEHSEGSGEGEPGEGEGE